MNTPPPSTNQIQSIRLQRGLSVHELAALLGYSSHAVIGWEQGEAVPERVWQILREKTVDSCETVCQ